MKIQYNIFEKTTIKEFIHKHISRNFYGYLKEHDVIYLVNGIEKKSYDEINNGDFLEINYKEDKNTTNLLSNKPVNILYEDEYYMIVYKEAHLQSIPSRGNPYDSIYNRLLYYFKDTEYSVHIVNRLDKETQGLMLVCKSNYARAILKDYDKTYYAKTNIRLKEDIGVIDYKIGRTDGIKRWVSNDGDKAITNYKLIDINNDIYTYEIKLETGRTHQIRVHFAYIGSPLINDSLYGSGNGVLGLCCGMIEFYHPILNKKIKYNVNER